MPTNYELAFGHFRSAAEKGNISAQINLGSAYANGLGTHRSGEQALYWLTKAADEGSAIAMNFLGVLFNNGKAVRTDYSKALSWYRKAEAAGSADARSNIEITERNIAREQSGEMPLLAKTLFGIAQIAQDIRSTSVQKTVPPVGSTIAPGQVVKKDDTLRRRQQIIDGDSQFLEQHRQQTTRDWQSSATALPELNILSDGPITGHRVARGVYRDAGGLLKGDIVVWADPKSKSFATVEIGISNNTPCKMHPDLYFYIGSGSGKMPIKTLQWAESSFIALHDKRQFGPAQITNSLKEPITFAGSAWFEDCQVPLGQ